MHNNIIHYQLHNMHTILHVYIVNRQSFNCAKVCSENSLIFFLWSSNIDDDDGVLGWAGCVPK